MITEKISTILVVLRKYWRNLAVTCIHFLFAGLCLVVLLVEGLDQATGEDKVQTSEAALLAASIVLKVLMFPLGYLMLLNTSMALGFLALNSLFIGFTPVWYRWLKEKWGRSKQKRAEQDAEPGSCITRA